MQAHLWLQGVQDPSFLLAILCQKERPVLSCMRICCAKYQVLSVTCWRSEGKKAIAWLSADAGWPVSFRFCREAHLLKPLKPDLTALKSHALHARVPFLQHLMQNLNCSCAR